MIRSDHQTYLGRPATAAELASGVKLPATGTSDAKFAAILVGSPEYLNQA